MAKSGRLSDPQRGGTEVYVEKLPKCDFCGKPALYDARTRMGPWANMCEEHFKMYGIGLGTGRGQRLIPRKALGEAERLRGEPPKELAVTMTEEDLKAAALEDIWYPVCPYCGAKTPAEPDAHYVYCQACNRRFRIINPFFSPAVEEVKPEIPTVLDESDPYVKARLDAIGEAIRGDISTPTEARAILKNRGLYASDISRATYTAYFLEDPVGAGGIPKATVLKNLRESLLFEQQLWVAKEAKPPANKQVGSPRGGSMDDIRAKAIAEEAAVKASELIGSKIAEQVAKEISGEVLHQSPISPHCERVLEEPPACYDFRGIRSYVLCRAWDIMEKEKRTRLPVSEAWSEARRVCVRE